MSSATGDGPGDGSSGNCFLTSAVVHRLGIEPDDGPTLTALRSVRDGYMTRTAERRAMVGQYYQVAPRLLSAIPPAHLDWDWIASRALLCASLVRVGREPEAVMRYTAMVTRLADRWLRSP